MNHRSTSRSITRLLGYLACCTLPLFSASATPASTKQTTLMRSIDVRADAASVWSAIGPFCAISAWHPAVDSCTLDGKTPPTRTLVTRDGAKFVELQVLRNDAHHRYDYSFTSSPLPVAHYRSTLRVIETGRNSSRIEWSSRFTAAPDKEQPAREALTGIYDSGLASIKSRLEPTG